jgi:hypothetical protein
MPIVGVFVRVLSLIWPLVFASLACSAVAVAQERTAAAELPFLTVHAMALAEPMAAAPSLPSLQQPPLESKSGSLAVLYSVILPGMGELYADRFDRGVYPLVTEGALWLGLIGVNTYGTWVQDDARTYAQQHAGIDPSGKSEDYFVHIENYSDIYDYNNQRLVERRLDELYPDEDAWRWDWDSEDNRRYYKDRRILSDQMHNAVSFFVLGMVANRIWSAIQSAAFVRRYNAALEQQSSIMPTLDTRLISRAGQVDELRLTFSWQ